MSQHGHFPSTRCARGWMMPVTHQTALGGTMRRTAALLACLLLAGAAGCSKSYDETVKDCVAALKERAAGDKSKPDACEGVKDDDYTALVMSQVLDDNGWVDENGDPDMGKILEGATEAP